MTPESSLRHSLALLFSGLLLASGLVACDTSIQTVQPLEDFNYTLDREVILTGTFVLCPGWQPSGIAGDGCTSVAAHRLRT